MNMQEKTTNTREDIDNMRVGNTLVFPLERKNYIKYLASDRGKFLYRKYKLKTDWNNRVVLVTRES